MIIVFTGHRDKHCKEIALDMLRKEFPEAFWMHGGAMGFDTQVSRYADKHRINQVIIYPNYKKYIPKQAPLERNLYMLNKIKDNNGILIALWDGRKTGGTFFTIKKAQKFNIPIRFITIRE